MNTKVTQPEWELVTPNSSRLYAVSKRALDITLSLLALLVLSPIFALAAAAIYLEDGGPIIFSQKRNGLMGREFEIYKFRSMCREAPAMHPLMQGLNQQDGPAFKMRDDPRVTGVGRLLRRWSIDELPQLLNIIKGEMSIVGPRPLPTYETCLLGQRERQRLLVKPGLVCFWQVSGRSELSFDDWMRMDLDYVKKAGILTDLKIIFMALPAVLRGRGAV